MQTTYADGAMIDSCVLKPLGHICFDNEAYYLFVYHHMDRYWKVWRIEMNLIYGGRRTYSGPKENDFGNSF